MPTTFMDKRVSQRRSHSWFRTYTYNCVLWGTQFDPLSLSFVRVGFYTIST